MSPADRRNDLDWLRVLGTVSVFFFHVARFFDFEDWHVKNLTLSRGLSEFVGLVGLWVMPLFFILSGAGVRFALDRRSPGRFLRERVLRLLVPLVFGILVLIPPQVYIERSSHGQFTGSFLAFLPHYFEGFYGFGGNFTWMGLHLWYLLALFLFSLLLLPVFLWLRGGRGSASVTRLTNFLTWPGALFLLALPLMALEMSLDPRTFGRRDFGGWNLFAYLLLFLYGYLLFAGQEAGEALQRQRRAALYLAIGLNLVWWIPGDAAARLLPPGLLLLVGLALRALNSWAWVTVLLGYGRRYLTFRNRLLDHANEAALPFYILHQSVIVVLGFALWS